MLLHCMYSNEHNVASNHSWCSAKKGRRDLGAAIGSDSLDFTGLRKASQGFIG
jgi:hypothetical protein